MYEYTLQRTNCISIRFTFRSIIITQAHERTEHLNTFTRTNTHTRTLIFANIQTTI